MRELSLGLWTELQEECGVYKTQCNEENRCHSFYQRRARTMNGSHTSFSFCKKSGSLPSPVPTVLDPAHSPQIPKHTHPQEVPQLRGVGQCFTRATPPAPSCRQVYLLEAWLVFSQLLRNFQEATIPVLLVGGERPRVCLTVHTFLSGFPLCQGHLVGRCHSDRCSVGPLLQGPVSHPVLRSLSDAGRVALCTPAHCC